MSSNRISSLYEYDDLADRIRQSRQADRRSVLVVEGPSDKRLIDRLTHQQWAIFPAGTRDRVPPAVRGALLLGVTRIAGLIDRDFDDYFEAASATGDPIFTYGEADLEAVLVRGPWFELLVEEFGSLDKISRAGGAGALRPIVVGIAGVIGLVRRVNAQFGWGIDFDALEFAKKVDARRLQLAVASLLAAIQSHLSDGEAKSHVRGLLSEIDPQADRGTGSFQGRDALEVVRVALRRAFGSTTAIDIKTIAGALRLTADERLLDVEPFPMISDCLAP